MSDNKPHIEELFSQLKDAVIMMVDDEPILMEILQAFLEEEGYKNFITISDSRQALPTIEDQQPDIVLLDLNMPHVDGFSILQTVREQTKTRRLPVIVLTSETDASIKLKALELGVTDFLAKPVDASELALRLRNTLTINAYQEQLAYYDSLTQLPNRQLFINRLEWMLKKTQRNNERLAVLIIALNKFKQINDSFGIKAGDEVLQEVSNRLVDSVRSSDVVGRLGVEDLWRQLAHIGGDEFSVLLPELRSTDSAAYVAKRVQDALANSFIVDGDEIFLSASVGISLYPEDGKEADLLIKHAGAAAAHAKQQGPNHYQFYSKEINALAKQRLGIEAALRRALDNNEFVLYYQPKVDTHTRTVKGCEALIRWNSPKMGMVAPLQFIPVAEESGLIIPIGNWVIQQACRQQAAWAKHGVGKLSVAVNVAGRQFEQKNLKQEIRSAVDAAAMDPRYLQLEITESMLMGDASSLIQKLYDIKNDGPMFSIDDFGTGYSSLSYLKRFPIDELKIDRSFIVDVPQAKDDAAIVRAIIAMARSLELNVVAEGVESIGQLEFLASLGCNLVQGYHFCRPLPAEEFTQFALSYNAVNE